MTRAQDFRDLADDVDRVEAGAGDLVDANLRHRDEQPIAMITVEVPLPLDGAGRDAPADAGDEADADPIPVTELTEVADGLGETITSRLADAGYETVADVTEATPDELEAVPQLGPKTVGQVVDAAGELDVDTPPVEDPDPPAWTPDKQTGGEIVPTRQGQELEGQKP